MNKKRKIIIVGAGPGGLAAGMILAHNNFEVKIYEREDKVGGRNRSININGYTFDTGPTFFMMKFIYDQLFEMIGRKSEDYLKFTKIDPMYRLNFSNNRVFDSTTNLEDMADQIEKTFPGESKGLMRFKEKERKRYQKLYKCLEKDYTHWWDFLRPQFIEALPILGIGKSLFSNLGNYFKPELIRLIFTFQSKYLGMSPWECPAGFTIIPYIEHEFGIYHVEGGLNQTSMAMANVFNEEGGNIKFSTEVKRLIIENRKVLGVELSNGEKDFADEVIINADFAYSMTHLIEKGELKKYSKKKLDEKKYSCSTFMIYLGIDKIYDLPHHNIYFADDYRGNIEDVFNRKEISKDFSFYVQNASIVDKTLAPKGKSTLYFLIPVPNNFSAIKWNEEKEKFKKMYLDGVINRMGITDLKEHIEVEKIITPSDWESEYNVYKGATFNLAHNLQQMLYFRPRNKFEELNNCYLVGGGTHPGSGLPTIYESGKISAKLIIEKYKKRD